MPARATGKSRSSRAGERAGYDSRGLLCPSGVRSRRDDRARQRLGYETSANLMAVSNISETEIDTVLDAIARRAARGDRRQLRAPVSRAGGLARTRNMPRPWRTPARKSASTPTTTMQLGFANTIEAIILGANRADATMGGLGRGAGNCPMELLLGFLVTQIQVAARRRSVAEAHRTAARDHSWGPSLPYNITGQLNRHPNARSSSWRATTTRTTSVLRRRGARLLTFESTQRLTTISSMA